MLGSLRMLTAFGFAMMTLGAIPVGIPYLNRASSHMYADDQSMTDAEYEALMNIYTQAIPPAEVSPLPGMTDAEYEALMIIYTQAIPPAEVSPLPGMTDAEYEALMNIYFMSFQMTP